ncbi:uncharacterized protein LOC131680806 [Topomyia yanbarensis]|uniref:uncharacterized protein LOC131680806 n=1 Tax=Topomyia yanbarensis TaxID=2498891 RepID=UPI00273BE991|nr:uncharacterized protein LOC131680806 [Topomyia yanbarensis]
MSASSGALQGAPMEFENGEASNRSTEGDRKQDGAGNPENKQIEKKNRLNREYVNYNYKHNDDGPFKVIVEKIFEENYKYNGINKVAVGLMLKQNGFSKAILDIKKTGKAKVLVYLIDWKEANRLTTCQNLNIKRYKAYIPKGFVTTKGVINGIPEDIEAADLITEIQTDKEVMEVFRMTRWTVEHEQRIRVPTSKVGLVFRTNKLPTHVKIFSVNMKVMPYITKTVMCNQCLRYGHVTDSCKGKQKCMNCGGSHEEAECNNDIQCANCRGPHKATDRQCPVREKQTEIKTLMATKSLTYYEAQQATRIPVQNGYSILEHADEFMTIKESYLAAVNHGKQQTGRVSATNSYKKENSKQNESKISKGRETTHESDEKIRGVKRKARNDLTIETETITLQKHLELRQKWENKIKELATQRETYKQTTNVIFKELTVALMQNDGNGYQRLIEHLKGMAITLGYIEEEKQSNSSANDQQIQGITE